MGAPMVRGPDFARLGGQVKHTVSQRHSSLPVNGGMMNLGIKTDLAGFQPLYHVKLPERAATIKQTR